MEQRNILFRGKRLDNGEWVYGGYFKHDTVKTCFSTDDPHTKHFIICDGFCDWGMEPNLEWFEVDPNTVCQFIDKDDKHGNHIFEGDIVKGKVHLHGGYRVRKGVIVYYIDAFKMKVGSDYKELPSPCEIIGNIHDNPTLLEV